MQDKYSAEVHRSLSPYGVYKKIADRGYKVKADPSKGLGHSDVEPGFPDGFFICKNGGAFIETKTGVTNFPFSDWRPNQRQWWIDQCRDRGIPFYIFLVMGTGIRDNIWPRVAGLISAELFLETEGQYNERKSLPYAALAGSLRCTLRWQGKGVWSIPKTTDFYQQFKLGELYEKSSSRSSTDQT